MERGLKVLLAAPTDKITLGVIGQYCKKALLDMGHEVEVFDFRKRPYGQGRLLSLVRSAAKRVMSFPVSLYEIPILKPMVDHAVNERLLELASNYRPDLVLVLFGENILPETVLRIKETTGARAVNWLHDTLLLRPSLDLLKTIYFCYDHIFIVDSRALLKKFGVALDSIHTLPLACEPSVHKRLDLTKEEIAKYGSDVAFLGTMIPSREKILESISDFDLRIWGRWAKKSPALKRCYREQDVYGERAVKIYNASKIVLDIHGLFGQEEEIFNVRPRVFEVPASGGFLLTNYSPQLEDFYKVGEEIAAYKNLEEMRELLQYYLSHDEERQRMAEKGFRRARAEHTYLSRMEQLLLTSEKGRSCAT
jgi:spore maturation protein CgeB